MAHGGNGRGKQGLGACGGAAGFGCWAKSGVEDAAKSGDPGLSVELCRNTSGEGRIGG